MQNLDMVHCILHYEEWSSKATEVCCVMNMAAALHHSVLSKAKQTNIPRNIQCSLTIFQNRSISVFSIHHILQPDLKACIGIRKLLK